MGNFIEKINGGRPDILVVFAQIQIGPGSSTVQYRCTCSVTMATANVAPPDKFSLKDDSEKEWRYFKQKFQLYLLATGYDKKPDDVKVALLLTLGGDELLRIYNALDFEAPQTDDAGNVTNDPSKRLGTVLDKLSEHFSPRKLIIAARYKFRCCMQKEEESINEFITRLKTLIKDCDYTSGYDEAIRDQIVFGCREDKLREKFLREECISLLDTLKICESHQASRRQLQIIKAQNEEKVNISKVRSRPKDKTKNKDRNKQWSPKRDKHTSANSNSSSNVSSTVNEANLRECKFCGTKHVWSRKKCPAYGNKCNKCGRFNHYAKQCMDSKHKAHVNAIDEYSDSGESVEYVLGIQLKDEKNVNFEYTKKNQVNPIIENFSYASDITENESVQHKNVVDKCNDSVAVINKVASDKYVFANLMIGNRKVKFQIDSGAGVNALPKELVPENVKMQPIENLQLEMWNHSALKPIGKCRIIVKNPKNGKKYNIEFIVVSENFNPLLGKRASEQMKFITINYDNISAVQNQSSNVDIFKLYPDVFENEIGNLPGDVHITLHKESKPFAISSCRVPIQLKEKVKHKLAELEKSNVICKVDKPTEWVSRMVVATKKNSSDLRLCIDPQQLNEAVIREMHPLPVIDDVLPELAKAKVFSKLDLSNGYWHCTLDEESSFLTTFQTPYGRYRWLRLPFGLAVSSEIFQKRLQTSLDGLLGVICIADDILVYGSGDTIEEANKNHDCNLNNLMKRCQQQGIRLNREKAELRKSELTFLGHVITHSGIRPDPSKVKAIIDMKEPTCVKEVQCFNGMINYLSKFMPRLSDLMMPIRKLMHKDIEWNWGKEQSNALKEIKHVITNAPVLAFFNQNKQLTIQCDASKSGLGAVLLQDGKPLSFASRALTSTEMRYAQIEKEMLAIVFALTKFHQYTFGQHTVVKTDHKPLKSIIKKSLDKAPKRLQGMLLCIQKYDITVDYTSGKNMHIADLLSRAYLNEDEGGNEFEFVNAVAHLPIRKERLERIKYAVNNDDVMLKLTNMISNGWPDSKHDVPITVLPYYHVRDELAIQDGLIFKGDKVIIPVSLRKEIKQAIHSCHLGIESCLRRARQCVYWPGMNGEIKEFISQCEICSKYQKCNQKETLMSHEISDRPWEKVGTDIFELENQYYLITVDYFSNFWEVDRLKDLKSSTTIRKLKAHFARYGTPSVLISDCGTQFTSDLFQKFVREWDIEHRTSSPKHPQSNGQAESAVKTAKSILKKSIESNYDPYLAILDFRNTPSQGSDYSPSQKNLGRCTRTLLPTSSRLLKHFEINADKVRSDRKMRNEKSAKYYNVHTKDLEPLHEDDVVRIKPTSLNKKEWDRGIVKQRLDERSYEISTDAGILRRNRIDLKTSNEKNNVRLPKSNDSCNRDCQEVEISNDLPIQSSQTSKTPVKAPTTLHGRVTRANRNVLPSKFKDYVVFKE